MRRLILMILCCSIIQCKSKEQEYGTKHVGDYEWMSTNLANNRFQNGDSIEFAQSRIQWHDACEHRIPAYCIVADNMESDGYLYNYWTIKDKRNIAPKGWRIATSADWEYARNIDSMRLDMVYDVYSENRLDIGRYWHRIWQQGDSVEFVNQTCYWSTCDSMVEYVHFYDANSIFDSYDADEGIAICPFELSILNGMFRKDVVYNGYYIRCVKE